jgi:hypothetical protein
MNTGGSEGTVPGIFSSGEHLILLACTGLNTFRPGCTSAALKAELKRSIVLHALDHHFGCIRSRGRGEGHHPNDAEDTIMATDLTMHETARARKHSMPKRTTLTTTAAALLGAIVLAALSFVAMAQTPPPARVVLFLNVRVFDGKSGALSGSVNVLVRGNTIERISATPIAPDRSAQTVLIDGAGRTLMRGLINAHWHAMLTRPTAVAAISADIGYTALVAGEEATATLMHDVQAGYSLVGY